MLTVNIVAALLFVCALIHTFSTPYLRAAAHRFERHGGWLHLLGEVEVVFGFWSCILIVFMAVQLGIGEAIEYLESRQYTEPLFVMVVMVIAATEPILAALRKTLIVIARVLPFSQTLTQVWLSLAIVPLLGSLITEPAAMTVAALLLMPLLFQRSLPEWLKYAALGTLLVNVSIGGTLTHYAAPPVLIVAKTWHWDTAFMWNHFGWKAVIAVLINSSLMLLLMRWLARIGPGISIAASAPMSNESNTNLNDKLVTTAAFSPGVSLVHMFFLAGVVLSAHHPVVFIGLFLLFIGYTTAYPRYQTPLMLREGALIGLFLAGLIVLGGMQQWWLQPTVSHLEPMSLFFGALGLTAITDNAALTYLGSLVEGITPSAQYMLMAGAVSGGGLTIIANAPNPAGVALLRRGFKDQSVGAGGLLLGALIPTLVAGSVFIIGIPAYFK